MTCRIFTQGTVTATQLNLLHSGRLGWPWYRFRLHASDVHTCWPVQEYNVGKRIEHSYKAIFNNGNSISAVDPKRYSQRFQEFMQKVFV